MTRINMSQFTENTSIKPVPKTSRRITTREVVRYQDRENKTGEIVIPKGYDFDGASSPTNLFAILCLISVFITPRTTPLAIIGYYIQRTEAQTITASALHDYCYTDRRDVWLIQSDKIFRQALIASDTPKIKAWIMRMGVRIWGWFYRFKIKKRIKKFITSLIKNV